MKILRIIPSPEPCVEAGWHAWQWFLESPVSRSLVLSLRPLGSLVFLESLSQPFFKVENHHFMLKGLLGDESIRVACLRDHEDYHHVKQFIESL